MNFDPELIRFKGKLILAAREFGASCPARESGTFVTDLYAAWKSSGFEFAALSGWLREKLPGKFLSANAPPNWVEDEPNWPFHNGAPMVFMSQVTLGSSSVERAHLSPGETVYLFGVREPVAGGFRMVYRTVSQFREFKLRVDA